MSSSGGLLQTTLVEDQVEDSRPVPFPPGSASIYSPWASRGCDMATQEEGHSRAGSAPLTHTCGPSSSLSFN